MRLILRRFALALVLSVAESPAPAQADAGDDRFAAAAAQYGREQWQEAGDEFAKLLGSDPDHPRANQARFYYGEALSQLGRYADAREQFGELLKRDPDGRYARQALFRAAEAAYLGGDERSARRDFEAFRQRFPKDELNAYVLAHLANLELKDEKSARARELFAAALAEFQDGPRVGECRLGLAQADEQLGDHDQARRGYRELIENHDPLADQALLHLAALENAQGNHAAALEALTQLAHDFPDGPLADKGRLGRGYALYKLGRHEEAEAVLRDVLGKPDLRVDAHYWLGLAQKARHQWSKAAETLSDGEKIDPAHRLNAALGFEAADALQQAGEFQAAADAFDRLRRKWPDSPWADDCWLGQLQACAQLNQHADCVRLADAFAAQYPDSPLGFQAGLAKGRSLYSLGKYADALESLKSCLALRLSHDPPGIGEQRRAAQSMLALCCGKLGRWAEANQILSALRKEKPSDGPADEAGYQVAEAAFAAGDLRMAGELFTAMTGAENSPETVCRGLSGLGWCRFKSSQWGEAAAAFERVLTQFPTSLQAAEAALMRGRALERVNDFDAALAMYRVVIDRYADSPRAVEALWQAARLHDQLHQADKAIELYARLAQEHANFDQLDVAIYRWAWLLRESNAAEQMATADDLFRRLRREFPDSRFAADATLRLAERALDAHKYDESQTLLAEIGESQTPAVRQSALYLQARVAMAAERWSAAEAPLAQLIDAFPQGEMALAAAFLRAEAGFRQGRYEQAAAQLADLAEKNQGRDEPWSATAELRRAQALAQLKQWSEALDLARAIENRFPQFEEQYEVDYLIGRCLAAAADFSGARAAYSKVIESPRGGKTQTAAMARWMSGESYFHQENYTAALGEYVKVEQDHPFPRWQAAALLQAGKCHEFLGDWRSAAEAYDRLLQSFPTSELAAEATRRASAAREHAASSARASKLK